MFPRAKKSYGQHFLADPRVVEKIVAAAADPPCPAAPEFPPLRLRSGQALAGGKLRGERVLEIGPGTGVLTEALLAAGARVTAVEADADLVAGLRARFPTASSPFQGEVKAGLPALDLVEDDILSLRRRDPSLGGRLEEGNYKLVANIPYNITSNILEEFLAHRPRPSRLVLMVQKEVADRLTAKPGGMGLLSVICQIYAGVCLVARVPRGAFRPVPKVDSAVVCLDMHATPEQAEPVIALAKAGFSFSRRQLHGNLARGGFGSAAAVKAALASVGLRPDIRAESLSMDDWARLNEILGGTRSSQRTK